MNVYGMASQVHRPRATTATIGFSGCSPIPGTMSRPRDTAGRGGGGPRQVVLMHQTTADYARCEEPEYEEISRDVGTGDARCCGKGLRPSELALRCDKEPPQSPRHSQNRGAAAQQAAHSSLPDALRFE